MTRIVNWIGCGLLPVLLAGGCSDMNHAQGGALGGGIIGATVGTMVGACTHHPLAGAAIGGATGALAGGAIGHSEDKRESRELARRQSAMRLEDVAYMAQNHVSDAVIINQIRATGALFNLTAEQITWLKAQGVSDVVISEMQATAYGYPRRVYTTAPVVVVDQPPPPVAVGVGIGVRGRF